jgi:hypothetical protein
MSDTYPRSRPRTPAALLALLLAASALPAAEPIERHISVGGRAEILLPPTRAEWQVQVQVQHKRLAEARNAVRATVAKLAEKLQAAGLAADDIQRGTGSQEIAWDHGSTGSKRNGFTYRMDVKIVLRDLARLDAIEDLLASDEAILVQPASFTRDDLPSIRAQARTQALHEARAKAEALAQAAGTKAGQVLTISEEADAPTWRPMAMNRMSAMAAADAGPAGPDLPSPGRISISASVQVFYRLE